MKALSDSSFQRTAAGEGVSELRVDRARGYRVYFVQKADVCSVLPAGGDKATQGKDVRKARALARELQEQHNDNDRHDCMGPGR